VDAFFRLPLATRAARSASFLSFVSVSSDLRVHAACSERDSSMYTQVREGHCMCMVHGVAGWLRSCSMPVPTAIVHVRARCQPPQTYTARVAVHTPSRSCGAVRYVQCGTCSAVRAVRYAQCATTAALGDHLAVVADD
jgi:hypothetical protein